MPGNEMRHGVHGGSERRELPWRLVAEARPSLCWNFVRLEERTEVGCAFPAESVSECSEYVAGCCWQYMKQVSHTRRRNRPHPLVLADTEYPFDTGSVVSAFNHDITPGSKRGLEKPRTVSILDVAQDNMRGGQFASLDFLYSRIGK